LKKKLIEFVFGKVADGEIPKHGKTTTHPNKTLSFQEWVREYQVSMLFDKKIVHF
jgi:hypothetical protein